MRTRKEIEYLWQLGVEPRGAGKSLCGFVGSECGDSLYYKWEEIWGERGYMENGSQPPVYILYYFQRDNDMTYLCRALSLNILLDDNEELLG